MASDGVATTEAPDTLPVSTSSTTAGTSTDSMLAAVQRPTTGAATTSPAGGQKPRVTIAARGSYIFMVR